MPPSHKRRRGLCWVIFFLPLCAAFHPPMKMPPKRIMPSRTKRLNMAVKLHSEDRAHFVRTCASTATIIGIASTLIPAPSSATTPNHMVNSVLSAYGIPMMNEKGDFTSVYVQLPDDNGQRTICAFSYPKYWVEVKKRDGLVSAANYQTGDGLMLNVDEAPGKASSIDRISALDIAAQATPSQGVVTVLKESAVTKGAVNYRYLTVKYNTVTRSGYDVERIAFVAATVRRKKLFTLVATVSGERRKKMDTDLEAIRASFRVGDVSTSETLPTFD